MIELQTDPQGVILPVRAHAGARKNAVLGVRQGMLRVAVTEAPEKGKANKAIAAVLSEALGVPKSSVELVSGATSAQKRFLVVGGDAEKLRAALERLVGKET
jgi:uncharacterized protein (TIGR00251 family)